MAGHGTWSRRSFLRFCGRGAGGLLCAGAVRSLAAPRSASSHGIPTIQPSMVDELLLADGLDYDLLISWGDSLDNAGAAFGYNNDYTAIIPVDNNPDDILLWVNHEYIDSHYPETPADPRQKTRADVEREMREVGGSILRVQRHGGHWLFVDSDRYNRRIDALTPIPIVADDAVFGGTVAQGTLANCAGGVTPWLSVLSCEENYDYFFGEVTFRGSKRHVKSRGALGWGRFFERPPEHYGWVVEIEPFSGRAKKLTALGRFAHESATVVEAGDGRCVVYMGDDRHNECIYKFIAAEPGSLDHGDLYVADTNKGRWLLLDRRRNNALREAFPTQMQLLVRTREAARIAGGTAQERPEGIARDPVTGAVFVALTKSATRPYGALLKIVEANNDPLALEFKAGTFLAGGQQSGFACPDNLCFDPGGNLWVTTDISTSRLNRTPYVPFMNNGGFVVPMTGTAAGQPLQLMSAPVGAELTGPSFAADGKTLFLSVQHPGEGGGEWTPGGHWPGGGNTMPKSGVVVIQGETLAKLAEP